MLHRLRGMDAPGDSYDYLCHCYRKVCLLCFRATGNSRFKGDNFPVLYWKIPENSRLELITYLHEKTFIIARKWPKLTHFLSNAQNSIIIAFKSLNLQGKAA